MNACFDERLNEFITPVLLGWSRKGAEFAAGMYRSESAPTET